LCMGLSNVAGEGGVQSQKERVYEQSTL
jgi:hypothetical protein